MCDDKISEWKTTVMNKCRIYITGLTGTRNWKRPKSLRCQPTSRFKAISLENIGSAIVQPVINQNDCNRRLGSRLPVFRLHFLEMAADNVIRVRQNKHACDYKTITWFVYVFVYSYGYFHKLNKGKWETYRLIRWKELYICISAHK